MATGIDCKLACSQPLQSGLGWAGLVIETKKGKESKGEGKKTKKMFLFALFARLQLKVASRERVRQGTAAARKRGGESLKARRIRRS